MSANIHASLDGTRVANYAQWASEQHYQDVLARPDIREHMSKIMQIADAFDPRLFTVRAVHHA